MKVSGSIIFILLLLVNPTGANDLNNLSTPVIINYTRTDYNASTQNWSITQDSEHIMWFGNNGRAMWFDGDEWGHVYIPNSSIVRSLLTSSDGKVYAGAFADFGEIVKNEAGSYSFHSWVDKVPEKYRNFTDLWDIHELNNTLYFHCYERMFVFRDGEFVRVIEPPQMFRFSFVSNGRLYVQEENIGLKVLMDNQFRLIEKGDFFKDMDVWFVGHSGTHLLVATQRNGAFIFENGFWNVWQTEANALLLKNPLFSAIQQDNGGFVFGTVQNGIIIAQEDGSVLKTINSKKGLQNNTILSMYVDAENNYWLGLDRGIDYLKVN